MGHALGAFAAGWLIAGAPAASSVIPGHAGRTPGWLGWVRQPVIQRALLFAGLGLVPDLDLLVGLHSTYTHSIGAILVVFVAAALAPGRGWRVALAAAAAYATHPLFDWLGQDTRTPLGIMALWPITDDFYYAGLGLFLAVSRQSERPDFWALNLAALTREVLILAPLAVAAWALRRPRRGSTPALETEPAPPPS